MNRTIVISIGNSDDRLSQKEWAEFCESLKSAVYGFSSEVHFFGQTPSAAPKQSCTTTATINERLWHSNFWDSFEEWMEHIVRPSLSELCVRYKQFSIVIIVGETEFIEHPRPEEVK